jgi:16S rRNA (adenine1518-N6/adenine1519-N6)-dimethyltransferase
MKLADLKLRMQELEVHSKKSLGQNFLISETVIRRIIEAVEYENPDFLIEIGPGLGSLTEEMLQRRPRLIELDSVLAEYWRSRGSEVIEHDALKLKWEELGFAENTWLVSNLPYQISSSLVIDRCFGPRNLQGMILMFQKEVAQRLMAPPQTSAYGLLSVMAQNFWIMDKVVDAAPRDFHPAPKIASRVLRFRRKPEIGLEKTFLTFLKAAFGQRRKFLLKNLKQLGHKKGFTWEQALESLKINLKARAEEISPAQFAAIYGLWKNT